MINLAKNASKLARRVSMYSKPKAEPPTLKKFSYYESQQLLHTLNSFEEDRARLLRRLSTEKRLLLKEQQILTEQVD